MHSHVMNTLGLKREVVAIVGSTASSPYLWQQMGRKLSETYEVLMPSLWNVGFEPRWQETEGFNLMYDAVLLKAQLDQVEGPVHLVAHSYGGSVALRFAREWPEKVASLSLFEPTVFGLLRAPRHAHDHNSFKDVYDIAKMATTAAAYGEHWSDVRHVVNFWHGEDAWSDMTADEKAATRQVLPKMGLEFIATLWPDEELSDYASIDIPTVILRGSDSPIPMRRIAFDLAKLMPQARFCTVAGASHMLPISHTEVVLPMVINHIDNTKPRFLRAA